MSYRISYGKPLQQEKKKRRKLTPILVCSIIVIGVAAAYYFQNAQFMGFMQALFPWTRPTVRAALSQFTGNLKQGISFGDAVTAFCREIMDASNVLH